MFLVRVFRFAFVQVKPWLRSFIISTGSESQCYLWPQRKYRLWCRRSCKHVSFALFDFCDLIRHQSILYFVTSLLTFHQRFFFWLAIGAKLGVNVAMTQTMDHNSDPHAALEELKSSGFLLFSVFCVDERDLCFVLSVLFCAFFIVLLRFVSMCWMNRSVHYCVGDYELGNGTCLWGLVFLSLDARFSIL